MAIISVGQITISDLNDINISNTQPTTPNLDQLWLDSSKVPNQLKRWDGTKWIIVNQSKIGGRNLIFNSNFSTKDLSKWTNNGSVSYALIDGKNAAYINTTSGIYQTPGKEADYYAFSFWAKALDATTDAKVGFINAGAGSSSLFRLTTAWAKYTFTTSVQIPVGQIFHVYSNGKRYYITDIKLEIGTAATDWTPAPEDIDLILTTHTTDITQTKADILLRATTETVNGINGRLQTAENSIMPDQLKSTVEDRVTANGSLVLATKSDIVQTKSEWIATFSQIGGRNLLLGSDKITGFSSDRGPAVTVTNELDSYGAYKRLVPTVAQNLYTWLELAEPLIAGKKYTFSFDMLTNVAGKPALGYLYADGNMYPNTTAPYFVFTKIKHTWTQSAPKNAGEWILWGFDDVVANQILAFKNIQLEAGEIITDWALSPKEMYSGITAIDRDGIRISRSNQNVQTQIGFDGLRIRDGLTEIASFTEAGAKIGQLQADHIGSDVINTLPIQSQLEYLVGPNETYTTITQLLNKLGKQRHLLGNTELRISLYGDIYDSPTISDFTGSGFVRLYFVNGARLFGKISLTRNNVQILIASYGGKGTIICPAGNVGIHTYNEKFVSVQDMNITSTSGYIGIYFTDGSKGYVRNVDMSGFQFSFGLIEGAEATYVNNRGNASSHAYACENGSIYYYTGTYPVSPSGSYHSLAIGYAYGSTSALASAYSPPATTQKTFTQTFSASDIYTHSVQYGAPSTYYGASAAQNRWDTSTGQFIAKLSVSSAVYNYIVDRDGGTTPTVQVRFRRKNSTHGTSNSIAPDWPGYAVGGATRGEFTPWYTIPYTLIESNGYTFSFGTGKTGEAAYAIWDALELYVSKKKTV